MTKDKRPAPIYHRAEAAITFGKHAGLHAQAEITSAGLLAIGALVAGILVSTALIVRVAGEARRGHD
jgi:hypothetical protein